MRNLSRSLLFVGAVAVSGLAACGDDVTVASPPTVTPAVTGISVTPSQLNLRKGEKGQLSAVVTANDASVAKTVTWGSSNAAVASVSTTGEVTAVAAGSATITATSTADANFKAGAQVVVTDVAAAVRSVTIQPPSALLNPGQTLQAVANVDADPGVARTVTWAATAVSPAGAITVSNTGLVTAVAPGTATITATSTADTRISGAMPVTVRVAAAASISIQSITAGGIQFPVDVNNVVGQIDVRLNVDPGDQQLAKVALLIDGKEVQSQTFGAVAMTDGAGAAVVPSEVVLSINTANFNPTTGVPNFLNGPRSLSAQLTTRSGTTVNTSPAATVTQQIILRNLSGFVGSVATSTATPVTDGVGFTWRTGSLTINALPVLYGNVSAPFTVPTVASANITFGGCNNFVASTARQSGATADVFVTNGTGAPTGVRTAAAAASGNQWTVTFSNSSSNTPGTGNVTNYEFDAYSCGNAGLGEVPGITAVGSDGFGIQLVAGGANGFLNNATAPTGPGTGIQPDARMAVRLDNMAPQRLDDVGGGFVAPRTPFLNTNTTSPIIRTNNWVNDALVLNGTATHSGATRTQALTRAVENGVSRGIGGAAITYEARVKACATAGACATTDLPASTDAAVTSTAGFAESTSPGSHELAITMRDAVGNTRNPSTTTINNGAVSTETISIDRTAPTLAIAGSTWTANGSITGAGTLTAQSIAFVATDNASGGAVPSGFLSLAGTPLLTSINRVDPANGSQFFCPSTPNFRSGSSTSCTAWVTGQSFQGPLTQTFAAIAGVTAPNNNLEAYYMVTSSVDDQAGNTSASTSSLFLYDFTAPVIGGIGFPGFVTGGATTQFTAPVQDNLDLANGTYTLTYPVGSITGPAVTAFQFPSITLGSFGSDVFTQSATLILSTPFIRDLQQGPAIPGAGAIGSVIVSATATDVAGNVAAAPSTATVQATQVVATPAPVSWAGTGMTAWSVTNAAASVSRATTNVTPANATSITLSAAAVGPTATFNNPFNSRVDFWVQSGAGTWRFIGSALSPSVTDNGTNRTWTFSATYTPDAYNSPFATNPSTTTPNIIAIGINTAGDALATAANTNITVTVP
jgi:hypothetical protein